MLCDRGLSISGLTVVDDIEEYETVLCDVELVIAVVGPPSVLSRVFQLDGMEAFLGAHCPGLQNSDISINSLNLKEQCSCVLWSPIEGEQLLFGVIAVMPCDDELYFPWITRQC